MAVFKKSKPSPSSSRRRIVPSTRAEAYNVIRSGHKRFWFSDLYVSLLTMPWSLYIVLIAVLYLVSNLAFAEVYFLDASGIENARRGSFLDIFFFSVQTMATIGYGRMSPIDVTTNTIVTIEALWGFTFFAFVTGLAFARFSRPTARVLFSDVAVLSDYEGRRHLKIRVANQRVNRIVDVKVGLVMLKDGVTKEGFRMRRFYDLPLVRDHAPFMQLTWTLMHLIDENSPLFGVDPQKLKAGDDEIIVSLSGHDEALSQTVHARHSYLGEEIICDAYFEDILTRLDDGVIKVNYALFHSYKKSRKDATHS